jgi:hypothetical protein
MSGFASRDPSGDFLTSVSGRVKFTQEVALVYAEELVAFEAGHVPSPRVRARDVKARLKSQPIEVVLDRLEMQMSFDDSHRWVMEPHELLGGLRPVEAVAKGDVEKVLRLAGPHVATQ